MWKVKKIFKRPKCHILIGKRVWFFGIAILDQYYNPIISIKTSNVGWKWKYDEVRHEWDPYIQIRLFRKWDIIFILFHLAYFTQHDIFKIHSCCGTCQKFIPF